MNGILSYLKSKDVNFKEELLSVEANERVTITGGEAAVASAQDSDFGLTQLNASSKPKAKFDYTNASQMFQSEPGLLRESMARMKEQFEQKGIKVDEHPELKRLFSDEQYFMETLKNLNKKN
jgi:hypothetical protein